MEYNKTLEYYENDLSRCNSKDEFITFLGLLAEDFLEALKTQKKFSCEWENITIDKYLKAIQAWCRSVSYMKAGDPFAKDENYVNQLKPFVDRMKEYGSITYDEDGNEKRLTIDLSSWLEPESPWSVLAQIFWAGKHWE